MPRKHVHKLGTPYRRNYDPQRMEDALGSILDGHMSFQQAADQHGVPKSTLYKKYRGLHSNRLGRPPAISDMEEKLIGKAILTASEFRVPFTQKVLQDFVQQYLNRKGTVIQAFQENRPGKDWCEYFLLRNPEIVRRNSENIKRCRAELNLDIIKDYFEHLRETIVTVPCENIMNYDETNMTDDPGNEKVLVRRGTKHASRVMDSSKSSTSIMFAALADGTILPPYVVFKAKYVYPDWVLGGPEGSRYNRTTSGWFDSDIFEDWFFQLALPHLRRKNGKKVIIGDNLGSHLSYRVITACEEHDIAFVFLPKNSTHICQPLDVAVFRPIKIAWRKILTEWKMHHKEVVPKQTFPSLLKKMLDRSCETMKKNIISGFEATGIFPFNPEKVLSKIKPREFPLMEQNNHIIESFNNVMTTLTKVHERSAPKRRTKINVPAGKSVSVADLTREETGNSGQAPGPTNLRNEPNETDSDKENESELESDHDIENPQEETKTEVKSACDISENDFIIASFVYNEGTKKECTKDFVAKIQKIKKVDIEISSLRMHRGKKFSFVYPPIEDISNIKLKQIKYKLCVPKEHRGIYNFPCDVL